MKRISHHLPPEALHKRGLRTASETVPFEGEFRIKNAGKTLAQLFGKELMQRLAARAATKKEASV